MPTEWFWMKANSPARCRSSGDLWYHGAAGVTHLHINGLDIGPSVCDTSSPHFCEVASIESLFDPFVPFCCSYSFRPFACLNFRFVRLFAAVCRCGVCVLLSVLAGYDCWAVSICFDSYGAFRPFWKGL
jgi:hypothetical protein